MDAQWAQRFTGEGIFVPLGERIKQLRKERRWSQDELAEKVGAFGHQISRYENDKATPSTETILKLAEAFDVSIDYLLVEGADRRPLRAETNGSLADRFKDLESLPEEDQRTLLRIADALIAKNRLRSLAKEVG